MSDKRFDVLTGMLKKKFKNKSVLIASGDDTFSNITVDSFVDTGSVSYNLDLGGGYARGRMHEIYGNEGSGKTTVALECIKTEQSLNKMCAFIDVERSLNKSYLDRMNIDPSKFLLVQTETAEQAWSAVEMITASKEVSFIVLDSLAGLVPELVWEKGIENDTRARLASVNTKALTMINPQLADTNTTLLLVNQVRVGQDMYGPSETTPGGNIIKFYSTTRTRIRRKSYEKNPNDFPYGQISNYQIIKNKIIGPGREGEIKIIFGEGIDKYHDIVNVALVNPHSGITLSGSWISYNGKTIVQGKENFASLLMEDQDLYREIRTNIMESLNETKNKKADGNSNDTQVDENQ